MKRVMILPVALLVALPALPTIAAEGAVSFEEWDLNGDGQVTVAEARDSLSNTFLFFDTNNDGYLDALDTAEESSGESDGAYAVDFDDDNQDDRVSLAEFTDRADDWVATMDHNGDGVVTLDDFGGNGFN